MSYLTCRRGIHQVYCNKYCNAHGGLRYSADYMGRMTRETLDICYNWMRCGMLRTVVRTFADQAVGGSSPSGHTREKLSRISSCRQ